MAELPPFLPFFVGAVLVTLLRGWPRSVVGLAVPLLGMANLYAHHDGLTLTATLLDYRLTIVRIDDLSLVFGYAFHIAAFLGMLFALHVRNGFRQATALVHAGSGIGAVFAGDLFTLWVFWELITISAMMHIWFRGTPTARAAGIRYLAIQVLSGLLLLVGTLFRLQQTGSIDFDFIGLDSPGGWLIFLAFGIKCAFPLLHNWMTDSYPESTATGTVFLSVYATKSAVYCLARGYPGTELLVYIGAVMTCLPIFYAVMENNLRRVLSYSLMNQLGFMVTGIGIGTALSLNGTAAHAFAHIIYKALLFMSMGAVLYRVGTTKASELGGLYRSMPWTARFCMVGAASISAFPLFSGFVTKSMVMAAALEQGYDWVWLALLFASAGVLHHAGIKVPFFGFFNYDSGIRTREAPLNMLLAMGLAALLCIAIGVWPWPLYELLPFEVDFHPYQAGHVLSQFQLLVFAGLAFAWLRLSLVESPELPSVNIDAEWVYRWLGPRLIRAAGGVIVRANTALRAQVLGTVRATLREIQRHYGPASVLARGWQIGAMVFLVLVLLGLLLIGEYL
jgi:multicomponent Na+:H+ antiporter subunit D